MEHLSEHRFPASAIADMEVSHPAAAEAMRQVNAAESFGLRLAAELEAMAEKISYLINTGQTEYVEDDAETITNRAAQLVIALSDLRLRRRMAYGTLTLTLGPSAISDVLHKYPPIGVPEKGN